MNEQRAKDIVEAYKRRRDLKNAISRSHGQYHSGDGPKMVTVSYGEVKFAMPLGDFTRRLSNEIKALETEFELEPEPSE